MLRLGEEEKERRRNHKMKIECPHLLRRAAINNIAVLQNDAK